MFLGAVFGHITMDPDLYQIVSSGHNLLILGQAGTGKSKTLLELKHLFEERRKCVSVTASTGMAAQQLGLGGTTLHRFSGIGDGRHPPDIIKSRLLHNDDFSDTRSKIQKTDILLIDEISMISAFTLNLVDNVLKGVRSSNLPFGGIQVCTSVFIIRDIKKHTH